MLGAFNILDESGIWSRGLEHLRLTTHDEGLLPYTLQIHGGLLIMTTSQVAVT